MNVKEGVLSERAKLARREYFRQWRRKNPDRVRAANERYWRKKALQLQNEESEEGKKDE